MRSVRVSCFAEPPAIELLSDPKPKPGYSIVRVEAATVGHIDRTIWSGAFLRHPPLPYTPGVEGSGVVVDGEKFTAGARVWLRGAGLGTAIDGTWSELVSVPDEALGLLPDTVSYEVGATFFSPCTSAWVALHDVGRVRRGERVLVSGASGAVGAVACQLALDAGASVVAVVSSAERIPLVPAGATPLVVCPGAPPKTSELQADLFIDTVGGQVLADLLPGVTPGGRVVLVGYVAGKELTVDLPWLVQRDVSLLPLNMIRREAAGRDAAPQLLARLANGDLQIITTTFPMEAAASALDWLVDRVHQGRAVLSPHSFTTEGREKR